MASAIIAIGLVSMPSPVPTIQPAQQPQHFQNEEVLNVQEIEIQKPEITPSPVKPSAPKTSENKPTPTSTPAPAPVKPSALKTPETMPPLVVNSDEQDVIHSGDGHDGSLSTTGDVQLIEDKYYTDLTINTGQVFDRAGYNVYVSGTFKNYGSLVSSPKGTTISTSIITPTPTSPSNTIFCNGTYWSQCPAGQTFVCPHTGNAYCVVATQSQSIQDNSSDSLLKIERCKAERDKNIAVYETAIPGMVDLLKQNYMNALMQQFKPMADAGLITASDLVNMARIPEYRAEKTQELRTKFKYEEDKKYDECINKI